MSARVLSLILALAGAGLGFSAVAAEVVWTNTAGGNWSRPANWSPNRLPTATDSVFITAPGDYTVTVDVNASAASLTLGGPEGTQTLVLNGKALALAAPSTVGPMGVLQLNRGLITNSLAGALWVEGQWNWAGGTIALPVTLSASATLNLSGAGTKVIYRVPIENYGTVNWTGSGALNFNHVACFNNYGTFNALGSGSMTRTSGVFARFSNYGAFHKLADGDLLFSAVMFDNYGTLDIAAGRVNYTGGTHLWADGSVVTGAGACVINGGTLQVNGTPEVNVPFALLSGSLSGNGVFRQPFDFAGGSITGDITAYDTVNWTGGKIQGTLTIAETGTLRLSGSKTKSFWFGQLDNYGTVVWTGTGAIEVDTGSVINNYGLFHAQNDAGWIWNNGSRPVFNNYGTFRKSGATGVSPLGAVQFSNWGTFDVQSGTVSWTTNVNRFYEGSVFTGQGTNLVNGATMLLEGAVGAGSTLNFASGTIGGHGTFLGTVNWTGGQFTNTVTFGPGSRLNVRNGGAKRLSAATLVNAGTLHWQSSDPVQFDEGAFLVNAGEFLAQTNVALVRSNGAPGTLINAGWLAFTRPPGVFSLAGHLVQQAEGGLSVAVTRVAGMNVSDWWRVAGTISLQGALHVTFTNGYAPARGHRFAVLSCQELAGTFDQVLGGGLYLAPRYEPTNLLLVAEAPSVVGQPAHQVVDAGSNAVFTARVDCAMDLQWFRAWTASDGTLKIELLPGATRQTLALSNVQTAHEGFYFVVATNIWGAATSSWARLSIYRPPVITAQPTSLITTAGCSVSLSVTVSGSGPFRYQWKRDGDNLAGQTNSVLTLAPVAASDAGKYKVAISDGRTSLTSAEASLTVLVPPSITAQPQSKNVNAGSDVKLEVKASGTAPLGYQWFKDGVPLAGANGNSLALGHFKKEQAGLYFVLVTNAAGAVWSEGALLQLNEPPTILVQPASQTVPVGTNVVLSVVASGVPAPTYQWRLNGVNLPGATNATLVFESAQPRHSGRYSVVVKNSLGTVHSAVAELQVIVPPLPLADQFAKAGILYTTNGVGRGANCGATKEAGEPTHAGKGSATNSVWISWWAPANGIATFSTLGSDFDTVLAVYRGTNLSALTKVAADDDAAGFHCSKVSFNAQAGTYYHLAVAGLGGACGNIILSWELVPTDEKLPEIVQAPLDHTGNTNENVVLSVAFNAFEPTAIQWFYQGQLIPGATNTVLVIENLQDTKVGGYAVRLTAASGRTVVSPPGDVQINTEGVRTAHARNKFSEAFEGILTGLGGDAPPPAQSPASGEVRLASAGPSLIRGYVGTQIFSTYGADKDEGEPDHCGIPGGASSWFFYQAPSSGTLCLDTEGSDFDTVLAVYTGPGTDFASLIPVACDNNSGADGRSSKVRFPAQAGTVYFIAVDGVGGASGTVKLNYVLGEPPTILAHPASLRLAPGSSATLQVAAHAIPQACYQWFCQGQPLPCATNPVLTLTNFQPQHAGQYHVAVSNALGQACSQTAHVQVAGPLRLGQTRRLERQGFSLTVEGVANTTYVLEASTNLQVWVPLATNVTPTGLWEFVDDGATNFSKRFYRVRPLP